MLPSLRHGDRCVYCAFRAQRLRLQSLRMRRQIHLEPSPPRFASQLPIRYTNFDPSRAEQNARQVSPPRSPSSQAERGKISKKPIRLSGPAGETGLIRRFLSGGEKEGAPAARRESFHSALLQRLHLMREELKDAPLLAKLDGGEEVHDNGRSAVAQGFNKTWSRFAGPLLKPHGDHQPFLGFNEANGRTPDLLRRLQQAYIARGQHGLDGRIKHEFYAHITNQRFTASDIKNQQALADLRYPSEWFPATRSIHRKIHLHVGPTNSGKTYHALQRLEKADSGVYAGPLRLLAHEVYTRMNAKGKSCALITGEERRVATDGQTPGNSLSACTVEMMPFNKTLDVAVIDEIQMIGNAERGWAWTQALLGVKAAEVHLCGEERTVPLIREICASLGEKLEVHRYERLSPLQLANESLDGDLSKLRKGDCVVSFSVMGIHSLRRQIERSTGKKVATVYGSLPPETRAQQARLFNEPNNDYDYLVASDAVGMGLNLAIKRIIFEASSKFDGFQHRTLAIADIKQIAGRAGRYRTAEQATRQEPEETESRLDLAAAKGEGPPASAEGFAEAGTSDNTGYVTTLQKFDFPVVSTAMASEPEPIRTAGLFPPASVLERFASYFPPGTPFSYILTRLHELSQMHTRFHLCGLKDQVWIADLIEPVQGLTVTDRNIICSSPASSSDRELWRKLMPAFAKRIAEQASGNIVDIEELPLESLEADVSPSREYLRELERLHKGVVCYLWLSYRFAGVFGPRALAFHVKSLVEEKIEKVLGEFSFTEENFRRKAKQREQALLRDMQAAVMAEEERKEAAEGAVQDIQSGFDHEGADDLDGEKDNEDISLREQTSLTGGGDHFAGEEDLDLEDPIDREEEVEKAAAGSFGEWRAQQMSGGSGLEENTLSYAVKEGQDRAIVASRDNELEMVSPDRPAAAQQDETTMTQEQPTAQVPPSEKVPSPTTEINRLADHNQFGGAPRKHISHLETNVTELDRNVDTRP